MAERASVEPSEASGYVPFGRAGEPASGDYQCSECGYGVAVQQRLPRCPMCGGEAWEPATARSGRQGSTGS